MILGIEIGGTKLQLGVGDGNGGPLVALVRHAVNARNGAAGIREQIARAAARLFQQHHIERIGIGFGGPVDRAAGMATKSHQVAGWDHFPLGQWCQDVLGRPAVLGNDCDAAALAEARFGAGRGAASMLYVTVGTGIGGGLVLGGKLHGEGRPAAAEIGHLRPGLAADSAAETVESLASGPAIAAAAAARIAAKETLNPSQREFADDLLARCAGDVAQITAQAVALAAADGNAMARDILACACRALGWAIAQSITLIASEVVVVGGGVSLIGEPHFFEPLRRDVARYVFPPLAGSYRIVPAGLGEVAVVQGAIALAAAA